MLFDRQINDVFLFQRLLSIQKYIKSTVDVYVISGFVFNGRNNMAKAKIKKLKGGFDLFVTEDEKLLATSSSRNSVYVYNLETGKLVLTTKTVSNVSDKAISPDKKLLAAKNTSGEIAIISLETGEEAGRNTMEYREGEQMTFTPDSKTLLDFDWDGRTMLLDCGTLKHKILDGPTERGKKVLPRVAYLRYDRYSNQIYKFIADSYGKSKGRVMTSPADPGNIAYEVIKEFPDAIPDHLMGRISFCRTHNFHIDIRNKQIVMTDKNFEELKRISFPQQVAESRLSPDRIQVSPCEQYIFFDMGRQYDPDDFSGTFHDAKSLSYLFRMDTMELVQEFDYDSVSDFTMIDEDRRFLIATWQGTYLGEV